MRTKKKRSVFGIVIGILIFILLFISIYIYILSLQAKKSVEDASKGQEGKVLYVTNGSDIKLRTNETKDEIIKEDSVTETVTEESAINDEGKWRTGEIRVPETMKDVFLVVNTTNPYLSKEKAVLYNSYKSKQFAPIQIDNLPAGVIVFNLDRLKKGTWYIAFKDITEEGFGISSCFCLSEEEYNDWLVQYKPEAFLIPRDENGTVIK